MPNGHEPKEYGGHKFADHDGTSDCQYGCGCWMGSSRSGGPAGLLEFGKCPNNPIDGKRLGGNQDYDMIVSQGITKMRQRLQRAEELLKKVKPGKTALAQKLSLISDELERKNHLLASIKQQINAAR